MKEKSHLYTVILVLVIIFIFSTIFFSNTYSVVHNIILMLLQLSCLLTASLAIKMSKRLLIGSFILLGVPLVLVSTFHMYFSTSTKAVSCILVGSYFLLLSIEILSQIVHTSKVDLNILSGLIASFLMIGIAFASIYLAIYRLDFRAFSGISNTSESLFLDMIYFSFATITTVGWGDICAINSYARIVAILESIVGLIFNAVVISRFANVFWFKK